MGSLSIRTFTQQLDFSLQPSGLGFQQFGGIPDECFFYSLSSRFLDRLESLDNLFANGDTCGMVWSQIREVPPNMRTGRKTE